MSMHASFGAEAVPLRDAFVSRLKTLTEVFTKLCNTQQFLLSQNDGVLHLVSRYGNLCQCSLKKI